MEQVKTPPSGSVDSRHLPLLVLLFAGSGCSALIYEIVWYQLLQLAIGSTAVSLGILLATYMGGLCLGSLWLPRLQLGGSIRCGSTRPWKLGIAACGVLVLLLIPLIDRVYVAGAGARPAGHAAARVVLRHLPAAAHHADGRVAAGHRALDRSPRRAGVSWWGLLYGGNTVGAVFGCLLAGFYLLRIYNMAYGHLAAAAINLAVAAVELRCWPRTRVRPRPARRPAESAPDGAGARRSGGPLDHLRHHRAFRRLRAGRGSGLDAAAWA